MYVFFFGVVVALQPVSFVISLVSLKSFSAEFGFDFVANIVSISFPMTLVFACLISCQTLSWMLFRVVFPVV